MDVEKRGHETFLGVWRSPERLGKTPDPEFLKRFEERKWLGGKSTEWWEWRIAVDKYGGWNELETLIGMQFNPDELVDYYSNRIFKLAEIAEPLIDRRNK